MKTRWTRILWLILAVLGIPPILYFFTRFQHRAFLDGVMGNLLAATLAVVVGIPIALEINRRAAAAQRRKDSLDKVGRLQHLLANVGIELVNNRDRLRRLDDTLKISQSSRTDLWELSNAIADAFSFSVFAEFRKSEEIDDFSPDSNDILVCYLAMERLVHDVRIASLAHAIAYSYGGGEPKANQQREAVLSEIAATLDTVKQAEEAQKRLAATVNQAARRLSS